QSNEDIYLGFDWSNFIPSGSFSYNASRVDEHSGGSSSFFRNFAINVPTNLKDKRMSIGMGLTRIFDTYDFFAEEIYPHPTSTTSPDVTYEREGSLNAANFGGAINLSDRLSVGISANVFFGRVIIEHNRSETYANQLVGQNQLVDFELLVNELDSLNLSGLNFTLGALYDIDERNRIGFSLRTPFKMKLSNDVTMTRQALGNGAAVPGGGDGFTGVLLFSDRESKVEMPLIGTFGFVRNWSDNFLSSLDIDYRAFSNSKFFILDSTIISSAGNKESFFSEEESNWNSAVQIRLGAEWKLQSNLGEIPVRFGLGYLPQPFRDVEEYHFTYSDRNTPVMPVGINTGKSKFLNQRAAVIANQDIDLIQDSFGSQVTAYSFSFGIGLSSPQRTLDIAYSFTSFNQSLRTTQAQVLNPAFDILTSADPTGALLDTKLRDANGKATGPNPLTTRVSGTSIRDHRIMISFTGYF
ncbi:MAG: outer membrane protein transport protein, partial [candidate division Zixibacteria bacterium]|nr:outer membrane protein transport protein [candidate division Zixibacteria bacterium]